MAYPPARRRRVRPSRPCALKDEQAHLQVVRVDRLREVLLLDAGGALAGEEVRKQLQQVLHGSVLSGLRARAVQAFASRDGVDGHHCRRHRTVAPSPCDEPSPAVAQRSVGSTRRCARRAPRTLPSTTGTGPLAVDAGRARGARRRPFGRKDRPLPDASAPPIARRFRPHQPGPKVHPARRLDG